MLYEDMGAYIRPKSAGKIQLMFIRSLPDENQENVQGLSSIGAHARLEKQEDRHFTLRGHRRYLGTEEEEGKRTLAGSGTRSQ